MNKKNELNEWKKEGKIHVWKFLDCPRSYRGWHIAFGKNGAESLKRLLMLLSLESNTCYRSIDIDFDREVLSIPGCNSKTKVMTKLRVSFSPERDDHINLSEEETVLSLELGIISLRELVHGLDRAIRGDMDYCITISEKQQKMDHDFWFW